MPSACQGNSSTGVFVERASSASSGDPRCDEEFYLHFLAEVSPDYSPTGSLFGYQQTARHPRGSVSAAAGGRGRGVCCAGHSPGPGARSPFHSRHQGAPGPGQSFVGPPGALTLPSRGETTCLNAHEHVTTAPQDCIMGMTQSRGPGGALLGLWRGRRGDPRRRCCGQLSLQTASEGTETSLSRRRARSCREAVRQTPAPADARHTDAPHTPGPHPLLRQQAQAHRHAAASGFRPPAGGRFLFG